MKKIKTSFIYLVLGLFILACENQDVIIDIEELTPSGQAFMERVTSTPGWKKEWETITRKGTPLPDKSRLAFGSNIGWHYILPLAVDKNKIAIVLYPIEGVSDDATPTDENLGNPVILEEEWPGNTQSVDSLLNTTVFTPEKNDQYTSDDNSTLLSRASGNSYIECNYTIISENTLEYNPATKTYESVCRAVSFQTIVREFNSAAKNIPSYLDIYVNMGGVKLMLNKTYPRDYTYAMAAAFCGGSKTRFKSIGATLVMSTTIHNVTDGSGGIKGPSTGNSGSHPNTGTDPVTPPESNKPASLTNLIGKDNYYRVRATDFKRRHPDAPIPSYYLNYADLYLHEFKDKTYELLSNEGKEWVTKTLVLLQEEMEKILKIQNIELNESAFLDAAFNSHVKAYEEAGILQLSIIDKLYISMTVYPDDLLSQRGLAQVAIIASDQIDYYKKNPNFALQQALELSRNWKQIQAEALKYITEKDSQDPRKNGIGSRNAGYSVDEILNILYGQQIEYFKTTFPNDFVLPQ